MYSAGVAPVFPGWFSGRFPLFLIGAIACSGSCPMPAALAAPAGLPALGTGSHRAFMPAMKPAATGAGMQGGGAGTCGRPE